jgi:hypothetical protein
LRSEAHSYQCGGGVHGYDVTVGPAGHDEGGVEFAAGWLDVVDVLRLTPALYPPLELLHRLAHRPLALVCFKVLHPCTVLTVLDTE